MGHFVTISTCALNQWALDWEGNLDRIVQSIVQAKAAGSTLRVGPELEITGYGCLDHFLEGDTYLHAWEMYAQLLQHEECGDILLDVGMPVMHRNVRYNCRILSYNKQVLLIRPKLWLANDGNYREMRYFTPWLRPCHVEKYSLPRMIAEITGQHEVDFGDAVLSLFDTVLGAESCEELFTPDAPHINMSLDGIEIITNSSGSHHQLRKLDLRMNLITEATAKCGGIYLYANQRGCDGDRLYYDGCPLIVVNGQVVGQGSQFSLKDVEVVTATVDLEDVRSYRSLMSHGLQSRTTPKYDRIKANFALSKTGSSFDPTIVPTKPRAIHYYKPEEEIALGPACWMWDYLRRSRAAGFFLPLSGGIDSCSTAVIVHSMCRLVVTACEDGDELVIRDARRAAGLSPDSEYIPADPVEFASRIFHTSYMGTENSSFDTRQRATRLANEVGSYHVDLNMDLAVTAVREIFTIVTGKRPLFRVHGGSDAENLALQNIQARLRMVLAYLFAQLLPWVRNRTGGLLVLGSANVDECLRGYLTKYDCSSADINPIGGISKTDLKSFIAYARDEYKMPILQTFLDATPTAELEPITETYVQSDEADMGMTYEELSIFGRLRKIDKCGPYSMFIKLYHEWTPRLSAEQIAMKVKTFFFYYAINRHKMTVITPSYHAESYSPDDNRFDLRPFLIPNMRFGWAAKRIDQVVAQLKE
ncbi:uncharacterized protein V1518DRAFT_375002 [Limtongia smithiae]|uniref:uncharacterized protein n=1 Tax=Limtongia smithiae TaxID=1125753 RepID=UPI0034CD38B0